jgi:hypothetical protein
MPNLTTEQRFVKPALDANPVPDHDLVVFRRLGGGGLRFHSLLGPDDKLSLVDKLSLGACAAGNRGGLVGRLARLGFAIAVEVRSVSTSR